MVRAEGLSMERRQAMDLATAVAGETQGRISEKKPLVSGKILVSGRPVRAQIVYPPVIEGGPSITFRRYSERNVDLSSMSLLYGELVDLDDRRRIRAKRIETLVNDGHVSEAMQLCVDDRLNVVVSGGTSTGKTTFARGLLDLIDPAERLVTIEDAFELFPPQPNKVMLKADRAEGSPRSAERLLEASLRMRPDRIILGELRGTESKTFLDAINTGHAGSITTIHADTALKAIDRLALMVMSVGINMAYEEVRTYCANSIDLIVQLGRSNGRRGIAQVCLPSSTTSQSEPHVS